MRDSDTRVSVIVPTYNSAPTLQSLYSRIIATMEETRESFEIVFVDDASADSSGEILRRLAKRDERVKVLAHDRNSGQGAALRTGLRLARGSILVTLDDDLQHRPEDIPRLLGAVAEGRQSTLVMAVPTIRKRSLFRELLAIAIHAVSNLLLDKPVPVRLTNFCAYHASLGEELARTRVPLAEAWITCLVQRADHTVTVPVCVDGSGLAQSRYDLPALWRLFRARARWFSLSRAILVSAVATLLSLLLAAASLQFDESLRSYAVIALAIISFFVTVTAIALTSLTFVESRRLPESCGR